MSKSVKPTAKATTEPTKEPTKPVLSVIKDIQPDAGAGQTKRQYSVEEKIRIVLEGLRGEISVAGAAPPKSAVAKV